MRSPTRSPTRSSDPLWEGWSAPRAVHLSDLEVTLCRAFEVRPARLHGSRVGKLTPFRGVLLALAVDVALAPRPLCARRYGLTLAGVDTAVRRARATLRSAPALRGRLSCVLRPLGIEVPG